MIGIYSWSHETPRSDFMLHTERVVIHTPAGLSLLLELEGCCFSPASSHQNLSRLSFPPLQTLKMIHWRKTAETDLFYRYFWAVSPTCCDKHSAFPSQWKSARVLMCSSSSRINCSQRQPCSTALIWNCTGLHAAAFRARWSESSGELHHNNNNRTEKWFQLRR